MQTSRIFFNCHKLVNKDLYNYLLLFIYPSVFWASTLLVGWQSTQPLKSQNFGRFEHCGQLLQGVQVYTFMWIMVVDLVMPWRGRVWLAEQAQWYGETVHISVLKCDPQWQKDQCVKHHTKSNGVIALEKNCLGWTKPESDSTMSSLAGH